MKEGRERASGAIYSWTGEVWARGCGTRRVADGGTVSEHRNMVVAEKRFFIADSVPIVPAGVAGFYLKRCSGVGFRGGLAVAMKGKGTRAGGTEAVVFWAGVAYEGGH